MLYSSKKSRPKSDAYLKRLINAMRQAFLSEEHVTSKVVSRLYRDVYRDTDNLYRQLPRQISRAARQALLEGRLTTCGVCGTGTFCCIFFFNSEQVQNTLPSSPELRKRRINRNF